MYKILIGILVVTIIGIAAFMILDPNINLTKVNDTSLVESVSTDANLISVTIEGEVENEGKFSLDEGATMADLIKAAGGVTSSADKRCYYDEAIVSKGMTYYIPGLYDAVDVCNNKEINKVNINDDSEETLMSVNGFSASVASSVVSYRTANGNFLTIEELLNVYGIGNATYKKVRNYVILHT